eukprot:5241644-Amphidinium_carterae.1
MGAPPAAHEEATVDQLSALRGILREGGPPYVDMTLWTPFNLRLQRKMATSGLQLDGDGKLRKVELRAPPDYETWRCAFQ